MASSRERGKTLTFYDGCIRTYGAATRLMMEVWEEEVGKPMGKLSGSPKTRFREALNHFERAIGAGKGAKLDKDLREAAEGDEVLRSLIDDSLGKSEAPLTPDVDDVPPSAFKEAIWDEADARVNDEVVEINLDLFLRNVVGRVVESMNWGRRFNVGENRHFPRMLQWLREVQDETTSEEGIGVRLMNRSNTGRVAACPNGPYGLKVRINPDWL